MYRVFDTFWSAAATFTAVLFSTSLFLFGFFLCFKVFVSVSLPSYPVVLQDEEEKKKPENHVTTEFVFFFSFFLIHQETSRKNKTKQNKKNSQQILLLLHGASQSDWFSLAQLLLCKVEAGGHWRCSQVNNFNETILCVCLIFFFIICVSIFCVATVCDDRSSNQRHLEIVGIAAVQICWNLISDFQ